MFAYILGLSAGIVPALSTGPVFLTLVQHAIDYGFKRAVFFIAGVAITDTSMILLTWLGLSQISEGSEAPAELSIGGGLLLILFGLVFIFKKESRSDLPKASSSGNLQKFGLFTQAMMLNGINPIIWGFWAAISNYAITEFNDSTSELVFFAGVLNMVWVTDLLKAYYSQKLQKILSQRTKLYIRIGVGILLLIMGFKLLFELFI